MTSFPLLRSLPLPPLFPAPPPDRAPPSRWLAGCAPPARAAGLIDEAGGQRELLVGVDDELSKLPSRSIPRDDVAQLAIQCLTLEAAKNRWVPWRAVRARKH